MAKNRRPPNQPISIFDPKSKLMSGKLTEPKHRTDKRQTCWCGDPNCGGGLVGGNGGFSATDADVENSGAITIDLSDAFIARSGMREFMFGGLFGSDGGIPNSSVFSSRGIDSRSDRSLPASLRAAREAVKDYLLEVNHETAWDDIVGNDAARTALIEAIEEPKKNPELYEYYGMTPPKGVLLFGPPGCGKTMFAKASAAAVSRIYGAKAEVMVINGPAIQSPYVGKTEETIRAIFKYAREYQAHHKHPLTVFFDEAEVLFPDRTGRTRQVASWEESNVAQFLSEMDGLNSLGAFVILATNRPEAIDEALVRDGRCDRKIKVERPTQRAVEHIVRKSFKDAPLAADLEDIVMAVSESFFNPHFVIQEGHVVSAMIDGDGPKIHDRAVNFCLEHIVSGAMVTGVSRRAKSRAFARDRTSGERGGIRVEDVIGAVREIFEENKTLEHSFAMQEFIAGLELKSTAKAMRTVH